MKCRGCQREYGRRESRCPRCGEPNPEAGFFQTSAVIISESGQDRVYQSVAEIPTSLRTKLEQSTSGANSGVILIADRRGRVEIANALRASAGAERLRLPRAILGATAAGPPNWRGRFPVGRRAVAAALVAFALAVMAVLFTHHAR